MAYKITENCVKCGTCADTCPLGIITEGEDKYVIDPNDKRVTGILLESANPVLVDPGVSIKIPYRWVQSIGDVIILISFPEHVHYDGKIE